MSDKGASLPPSPIPEIAQISFSDLGTAFYNGLYDYFRGAEVGIVFVGVFTIIGAVLMVLDASLLQWMLWFCVAFPLVYPFIALALFDVSREIEELGYISWGRLFRVAAAEKDHHLFQFGLILVLILALWVGAVYGLMSLLAGMSVTELTFLDFDASGRIYAAIAALISVLVFAFIYAVTLFSLPVILDRELDIITAMAVSFDAAWQNKAVLGVFGLFSLIALGLSTLPYFTGLMFTLPVLVHTNWHLYRQGLRD